MSEKESPDVIEKNDENDEVEHKLFRSFQSFLKTEIDLDPVKTEKQTIPTGIDILDTILGGGIIVGALSIFVGQPGCGKSMLASQCIAGGQKSLGDDFIPLFLDSEESTTKLRLKNLGVNIAAAEVFNGITVETVFEVLEKMAVYKEIHKIETPSMIVWDSIANTLTQREMEATDINTVIGYKARMLSFLIPKYIAKCNKYNISLVAVNQLRDALQMGPYGTPRDLKFMSGHKVMPGGNSIQFNAFQLIEMKIKSALDPEKFGFDGIMVSLKCVKNKLFPINIPISLVGDFVNGFDNFWTNYMFLVDNKRLKTGAWNYLISYPDKKFRTKDAKHLYHDDEEFKNHFDSMIKETIKIELIDKYEPTEKD